MNSWSHSAEEFPSLRAACLQLPLSCPYHSPYSHLPYPQLLPTRGLGCRKAVLRLHCKEAQPEALPKKVGISLFSQITSDWRRGYGFKLHQGDSSWLWHGKYTSVPSSIVSINKKCRLKKNTLKLNVNKYFKQDSCSLDNIFL